MNVEATHPAAPPAKCLTCEVLRQGPLACAACEQILAHVQSADYFEVFGLPRSHRIDEADLARRYREISRNIHPDRFAAAGPDMQSFALRTSAAVNRAHEVLRDPFRRAEYLLESAGGSSAATDKRVPDGLLAEVMMLREELEDARASGDAAAISAIAEGLRTQRAALAAKIAALCDELVAGRDGVAPALRLELNAMKYLSNLMALLPPDGPSQ